MYYLTALNCSWSKAGHRQKDQQFIPMFGIVSANVCFVYTKFK